ncbi:winged helix-turn-helix domain-containing protein [Nanchangia anserum]|uniref:helix-turn-helix domain-containing protein n=1 Tax=Nanchangia anserum TaxID=2692125 RepID=UPI0018847442|nr:helix-turn-helix domain-containing protein [Nanchangia anserum]QOX81922.1 winged helix-turn-helix domain-containing protein [Nanchangia anserum]
MESHQLSRAQKPILTEVARWVDPEGVALGLTRRDIQDATGYSRTHVAKILTHLSDLGLIRIRQRHFATYRGAVTEMCLPIDMEATDARLNAANTVTPTTTTSPARTGLERLNLATDTGIRELVISAKNTGWDAIETRVVSMFMEVAADKMMLYNKRAGHTTMTAAGIDPTTPSGRNPWPRMCGSRYKNTPKKSPTRRHMVRPAALRLPPVPGPMQGHRY